MSWPVMLAASVGDVLLPAAVALVTTLAIEYAAKPHLEARKARILERQRAIRGLEEALVRIGQILAYRDDPVLLDGVRDRVAGHAALVLERTQTALVVLDFPDDISSGYHAACAPVTGLAESVVRGWDIEPRVWTEADAGSDRMSEYHDWLACPWWRVVRRRKLRSKLRRPFQ